MFAYACPALRQPFIPCPKLPSPPLPSSGFDPFSGMPFELRALECALDAAVQQLAHEVAGLEGAAYPALQRLAAGVSRSGVGCRWEDS